MKKWMLGLGLLAAACMAVSATAEEASLGEPYEVEVPDLEIPGEYDFEATRIQVPSNGLMLDAILTLPVSDAEKFPMVILTHGFMADYNDTLNMSIALAKNGFASIRMSLEGSGESEGLYENTTFTTQKEDVINTLNYAKELPFTDTENLFLAGKSQGGFASANAAIDVEDEINAVCLFFPAFCIPDDFRSGRVMFSEFDINDVPESIEMFPGFSVGKGMIEEGLAMDVFTYFPVIEKDVLIIHGDADPIVNVSYAEQMAELYANAELVIIPGGSHGFEGDDEVKALMDMVEFFKAHLK